MRSSEQKDQAILWCLSRSDKPMYAKDICAITGLWYINIYARLGYMEDRGLVKRFIEKHGFHRHAFGFPSLSSKSDRIRDLEAGLQSYAEMLTRLQPNRPVGVHCPKCSRDMPECAGPSPCHYLTQSDGSGDANG